MRRFSERILEWYDEEKRDLPWRGGTPYEVWLSEMMLQQTQVKTVIPFFHRFLKRFACVEDLAQGNLDEVYALWQGLGYYHRARYPFEAAKIWVQQGRSPENYEAWKALPGVGPYTAAALTAIVLDQPAAAIDGNIKRVFGRHFGLDHLGDIEAKTQEELPGARWGDYTQGLMDLGATLCTPKQPQCQRCPVSESCQMRRGFWVPKPRQKPAPRLVRHGHVYLVHGQGGLFCVKNDQQRLLRGLWGFPMSELSQASSPPAQYLPQGIAQGEVCHDFTHFRLYLQVWHVEEALLEATQFWSEGQWMSTVQRREAAFSKLMRKVEQYAMAS